MAINDMAGERLYYHVWDIPREFLGHNFASGLRTLKPKKLLKNPKNPKNLKTFFSKNLGFSSLGLCDRPFTVASPRVCHMLPASLRLVDNYTRFRICWRHIWIEVAARCEIFFSVAVYKFSYLLTRVLQQQLWCRMTSRTRQRRRTVTRRLPASETSPTTPRRLAWASTHWTSFSNLSRASLDLSHRTQLPAAISVPRTSAPCPAKYRTVHSCQTPHRLSAKSTSPTMHTWWVWANSLFSNRVSPWSASCHNTASPILNPS